jgi:hypothetical protein
MIRMQNLERAWVKAPTLGLFNTVDRTCYASDDECRLASLWFPSIGKPEYRVYVLDNENSEGIIGNNFLNLGQALDYLHLFLEGTPA